MQPRPAHLFLHPALILITITCRPLKLRLVLLDKPISLIVVIAQLFEQVSHIDQVTLEGEFPLPPVRTLLQQKLVIFHYLEILLLWMPPFLLEVLLDGRGMRLSESSHHVEVIGELAV